MQTIKLPDFVAGLAEQRTQPCMLVTRTVPNMRKRGNPLTVRGLVKWEGRNGFIGADYENAVNAQREREQQPTDGRGRLLRFKSSQIWRGNGQHVAENRHLVRHKRTGELYLIFYPSTDAAGEVQPLWQRYEFVDTCETCDPLIVRPWLKAPTVSQRQQTRKPVRWRLIALANVARVRLAGELYALLHPS